MTLCKTDIEIITGQEIIMQTVKCGTKDYDGILHICKDCRLKENSEGKK
jgi:hypothetical protein